MDKINNVALIIFVIVALWSTYMFGCNKGFNQALITNDTKQSTTLQALQLAGYYKVEFAKCRETKTGINFVDEDQKK